MCLEIEDLRLVPMKPPERALRRSLLVPRGTCTCSETVSLALCFRMCQYVAPMVVGPVGSAYMESE